MPSERYFLRVPKDSQDMATTTNAATTTTTMSVTPTHITNVTSMSTNAGVTNTNVLPMHAAAGVSTIYADPIVTPSTQPMSNVGFVSTPYTTSTGHAYVPSGSMFNALPPGLGNVNLPNVH